MVEARRYYILSGKRHNIAKHIPYAIHLKRHLTPATLPRQVPRFALDLPPCQKWDGLAWFPIALTFSLDNYRTKSEYIYPFPLSGSDAS
jgi:hypothetical protein